MTCCPLESSDDGPSAFEAVVRRARKPHSCCECGLPIAPGQSYEHASGIWDGRPDSYKTCLFCVEIRDHFACNGYIFGQVWSDIYGNFFPDMKCGGPCMEGLSPAAKARLIDLRMEWLFEERPEIDGAPPPWHPPLEDAPDPLPPPTLHSSKYMRPMTERERNMDDLEREREIEGQIWWMFCPENPENKDEVD